MNFLSVTPTMHKVSIVYGLVSGFPVMIKLVSIISIEDNRHPPAFVDPLFRKPVASLDATRVVNNFDQRDSNANNTCETTYVSLAASEFCQVVHEENSSSHDSIPSTD